MAVPGEQLSHFLVIVGVGPRLGLCSKVEARVGGGTVVAIHHLGPKAGVAVDRHVVAGKRLTMAHVLGRVLVLRLRLESKLCAHAIVH